MTDRSHPPRPAGIVTAAHAQTPPPPPSRGSLSLVLGRHLLVDFTGCAPALLDDLEHVRVSLLEAVRRSGATIITHVFHQFSPQGITGVVVIAESHVAIHTWPEHGYAAVDIFTCSPTIRPEPVQECLREAFAAEQSHVALVERGI
ncbi:adenosylmethionine decarboxylase [Verrucomicrobia bacterium LW23]|nr:adenosylmethionine decarboxylase [Verrucomicrobia bacterium LW23]